METRNTIPPAAFERFAEQAYAGSPARAITDRRSRVSDPAGDCHLHEHDAFPSDVGGLFVAGSRPV